MYTTYERPSRYRACWRHMLQTLIALCAFMMFIAASAQAQPVVSYEMTPPVVSEADEMPMVVWTFTVDGEIPEPVFDAEGNVIAGGLSILFDGGQDIFPYLDQMVGGFSFEGLIIGNFFDPVANIVELVLLQNVATFTFNVLNDVAQEPDQSFTFRILNDETGILNSDYTVNPDASMATVTLTDGNGGPGVGPTVGLSVTQTELAEGDTLTVNFTVDGTIPAEGVQVLVASETPGAIGDFSIFNADGSPAIELTGIAGFPEAGDGVGSSFLVTIIAPQASMTLGVFDDGPTEGLETLTFDVVDGEVYEVNPAAGSVTVTISDGGESAVFNVTSGTTSLFLDLPLLQEATGLVFLSVESTGMPFSDAFQVGFPIAASTDFSFAPAPFTPLGGTIAHEGSITFGRVGASPVTLGNFTIGFDASRVSEMTSGFFVSDTLDDALGLEVLFDISPPGTVRVSGETFEVSGTNLLVSPELAMALGQPDLAGTDIGNARIDAMVTLMGP